MDILNRREFLKCAAMLSAAAALSSCRLDPVSLPSGHASEQAFLDLVEEYTHSYFKFHPIRGPESGDHTNDGNGLDDLSDEALAEEAQALRNLQKRLGSIPQNSLSADLALDAEVFAAHLEARLDELEVSRPFARDPYFYADIIQMGILYQMLFDYAGTTLDSRLQIALKQLEDTPTLMQNAILKLQSVPLELIEYGITSLGDTQSFLEIDVPAAFSGAHLPDGALAEATLKEKIRAASQAIGGLITHLEALRVSPDPKPPFALGEEGLAKRLRIKHGISLPDQNPFGFILSRTLEEIKDNQAAFEQAAHALDPSRTPMEVWAEIQTHHPRPGEVAAVAQKLVDKLVSFLKQKDLIELPGEEAVEVKAAPAFMLYWYATMWQTGPFEPTPAPPAVYYVSDPAGILKGENGQTDEEAQNEFLMSMVTPELWTTTAHESYPGHFVQGCALKKTKRERVDTGQLSRVAVSSIFMPFSFSEGWAHYCEQMVREEGLLQDGDFRDYQEYLMGQRSDALMRLCRTYAGIQLHLGQMTVAEAADFFEQNSFVPREMAETEAQRGAYEPDYILYAIGKMALLQLRDDYRAAQQAQGKTFTLRQFHDELLSLGQYPLPVLRRKMLPGDQRELISK